MKYIILIIGLIILSGCSNKLDTSSISWNKGYDVGYSSGKMVGFDKAYAICEAEKHNHKYYPECINLELDQYGGAIICNSTYPELYKYLQEFSREPYYNRTATKRYCEVYND